MYTLRALNFADIYFRGFFAMHNCRFIYTPLQSMVSHSWLQRLNTSRESSRNLPCMLNLREPKDRYADKGDRHAACINRCKPDCTKVAYEASTTERKNTYNNDTRIYIYFPSLVVHTLTERHRFNWSELFGIVDGTLGLCTGMSALSLLEILFVLFVCLLIKCRGLVRVWTVLNICKY